MNETLNQIHALANERHALYRLAGKGSLTPAQRNRLRELDSQLTVLWDQYRRELASRHVPVPRQPAYSPPQAA